MSTPKAGARHGAAAQGHDTIVKRSRGGDHDDDHGGNWKVAFADFCLALMCLFLLLWLMNAREHEAEQRRMEGASRILDSGGNGILDGERGAVAGLFDRERAAGSSPHFYEGREDLDQLAARLRRASEEAGLQENLGFEITESGLRVLLHDTDRRGVFRVGSAAPDPRFRELIRRLGSLFTDVGNPILVIGHTDARPYRGFAGSNWHLSSERALSSRDLLIAGGMPAGTVLQTAGMADNALLVREDPLAAANRRIEFLVLSAARAATLKQMFGVPENPTRLIDGVDAVGRMPGNVQAAAR